MKNDLQKPYNKEVYGQSGQAILNQEDKKNHSQVGKPSQFCVEEAKNWVDNGSRL